MTIPRPPQRTRSVLRRLRTMGGVAWLVVGGCAASRSAVVWERIPPDRFGSTVRLRGSVRGAVAKNAFVLPSGEVLGLDRSFSVPPEPPVVLEGVLLTEPFKIDPDSPSARPQNVDPDQEYRHTVLRHARLVTP